MNQAGRRRLDGGRMAAVAWQSVAGVRTTKAPACHRGQVMGNSTVLSKPCQLAPSSGAFLHKSSSWAPH